MSPLTPPLDCDVIRDMPHAIQPIRRLETVGVEALKESELLSLAFKLPSLTVAENLLAQHGGAPALVGLSLDHLSRLRGVGRTKAAALLATLELARRCSSANSTALPTIRSTNELMAQVIEIRDLKKEHLVAFFLNARHQLIKKELISIGTLTASLAHPREIFAPAIGHAAAGLILAHNHPSGDPSPSEEDQRLTRRIAQAGHIMGIELLDHVIVAASGCYSFKSSEAL